MNSRRSYYFRGILTGLFISLTYKAFLGGAFVTAVAGLAVIAVIANAALGVKHGE